MRITNEVLLEKIAGLHSLTISKMDGISERLDKLNGQVDKNTEFVAGQRIKNREYDKGIVKVDSLTSKVIKNGTYIAIAGAAFIAFKDKILALLGQ